MPVQAEPTLIRFPSTLCRFGGEGRGAPPINGAQAPSSLQDEMGGTVFCPPGSHGESQMSWHCFRVSLFFAAPLTPCASDQKKLTFPQDMTTACLMPCYLLAERGRYFSHTAGVSSSSGAKTPHTPLPKQQTGPQTCYRWTAASGSGTGERCHSGGRWHSTGSQLHTEAPEHSASSLRKALSYVAWVLLRASQRSLQLP